MKSNKVSMDGNLNESSVLADGESLNYNWKETSSTVEVFYPLPDGIAANSITISFTSKTCNITLKNKSTEPLLNLELKGYILTDDSTWTCSNGLVEITMEKRDNTSWGQLESKVNNNQKIAL